MNKVIKFHVMRLLYEVSVLRTFRLYSNFMTETLKAQVIFSVSILN